VEQQSGGGKRERREIEEQFLHGSDGQRVLEPIRRSTTAISEGTGRQRENEGGIDGVQEVNTTVIRVITGIQSNEEESDGRGRGRGKEPITRGGSE
jgi:hypothetical protein